MADEELQLAEAKETAREALESGQLAEYDGKEWWKLIPLLSPPSRGGERKPFDGPSNKLSRSLSFGVVTSRMTIKLLKNIGEAKRVDVFARLLGLLSR